MWFFFFQNWVVTVFTVSLDLKKKKKEKERNVYVHRLMRLSCILWFCLQTLETHVWAQHRYVHRCATSTPVHVS